MRAIILAEAVTAVGLERAPISPDWILAGTPREAAWPGRRRLLPGRQLRYMASR